MFLKCYQDFISVNISHNLIGVSIPSPFSMELACDGMDVIINSWKK